MQEDEAAMAKSARENLKVAVLAGGISDEREISLDSGKSAKEALQEAGYGSVELLDPGEEGFLEALASGGYDVAFIALHGKGGEDGMIQSILEYLNIPYTGSDAASSACAIDKDVSKLLYAREGIPTARGVVLKRGDTIDIERIVDVVGRESFVKPAANGSSYGASLVKDSADLDAAIEHAFEYGDKILVEEREVGTEVTVGVIGDGPTLRALPIVEICMPGKAEYYDLEVKYSDPTDIHRIPARLPEETYQEVQRLACCAHEALGCYGISRSDFIVTAKGPVILETNTIPGMTPTSLFPDEVRHAGSSFPEACAELVDLALARAGR